MSSTMALNTDQGKQFLKRYEPASDLDLNPSMHIPRIAFTHAVQEYLGKLGFPIPRLLRNSDGDTLTVEGSDIYAIFRIRGSDTVTIPLQGNRLGCCNLRAKP